jgi:hypothetical protein
MAINFLKGEFIPDKPKRKNKNPEAKVGEKVDAYLKSIGAYMRTIKSDGRKLPNGRWIPSSQGRGISDRIGVLPGGRFIAVELKAVGKKATATTEQLDFLSRVIALGGCGLVADSVEDVKAALNMDQTELLNALPQKSKTEYSIEIDPDDPLGLLE